MLKKKDILRLIKHCEQAGWHIKPSKESRQPGKGRDIK